MKLLPNKIKIDRIELTEKAYLLEPSASPLYILASSLNYRVTEHPLFTWSTSSLPLGSLPSTQYNIAQVFRKPITWSNDSRIANDHPYQRKKKTIEQLREIERAFLMGHYKHGATRENDTTGGLDYYICNKTKLDFNHLTEHAFLSATQPGFRYGSSTKYLFLHPQHRHELLRLFSPFHVFPKERTYGIEISQLITQHGIINCVPDVMITNALYMVQLDDLVYRPLRGRDIAIEYILPPGQWEQVCTECGLEIHNLDHHLIIEV